VARAAASSSSPIVGELVAAGERLGGHVAAQEDRAAA
jgi:hypothetical protein